MKRSKVFGSRIRGTSPGRGPFVSMEESRGPMTCGWVLPCVLGATGCSDEVSSGLMALLVVAGLLLAGTLARRVHRTRMASLRRELLQVASDRDETTSQYLTMFQESLDAMMTLAPPSWNFELCNRAALSLFHVADEAGFRSLSPTTLSPEVQPDGRDSTEKALSRIHAALRDGSAFFAWTHRTVTGETFPAEVLLTRAERKGRVFLQATVRDITLRVAAEEVARASGERLETLFNLIPEPCFLMSLKDGRIIHVNEALLRLSGFARGEFEGRTEAELDAWASRADRKEYVARLRRDGRVLAFEAPFRAKSGEMIVGSISGEVIRLPNGPHVLNVLRDVTLLSRVQHELQSTKAFLGNVINALGDPVFVKSEDRRFVLVNDALCSMVGVSREILLGLEDCDELFPEDQRDVFRLVDADVFATGEQNLNEESLTNVSSGDVRTIVTSKTRYVDPDGKRHVVGSIRDVTERRLAESALQRSEDLHRTILQTAMHGFWVADAQGRLIEVNDAYCAMSGFGREELLARTIPDLEVFESRDEVLARMRDIRTLGPTRFESSHRRKDGTVYDVEVSVRYRPGEGGRYVAFLQDITQRKTYDEVIRRKSSEVERFAYMISHDMNAPIVTVMTFLGYLDKDLEQGNAGRVAEDMGFIRNGLGRVARMREDLLKVSRVGVARADSVDMTLANLTREALNAVAGAISSRGVQVHAEVSPLHLVGDRHRLEEVWQNLVENAVKYMGAQPSPRIEVGVCGVGPEAVFFVRDNGMGIDPAFHARVFGPFEKLDATSEGTGLGLALVKRIVELYAGRVWVESEGLGQGSTFRFTLPGAFVAAPESPAAA